MPAPCPWATWRSRWQRAAAQGAGVRPLGGDRNLHSDAARRAAPAGHGSRARPRAHGARGDANGAGSLRLPAGLIERARAMMLRLLLAIAILATLVLALAVVRTVALPGEPAPAHARPAIARVLQSSDRGEDRARNRRGALSFSLIKHTTLLLLGSAWCWPISCRSPLTWPGCSWKPVSCPRWLMLVAAIRHSADCSTGARRGRWLLPMIPLLRALALAMKPATAVVLRFFYSLMEIDR